LVFWLVAINVSRFGKLNVRSRFAESEARGAGVLMPPEALETLLEMPIPDMPLVLRDSAVGFGLSVFASDFAPGRRDGEAFALTVTSIKLGLVDRLGLTGVASGLEIVGVSTSVFLRIDRASSEAGLRFLFTESTGEILVMSDCCGRRVIVPAAAESSD
jgi:hypothetical protein